MYLNTGLIGAWMSGKYNKVKCMDRNHTSVCSFRIYDGTEMMQNHLYLIRAEQLAFLETGAVEAVFLCAGVDLTETPEICQDLILIGDTVDLTELINCLTGLFDTYNQWEQALNRCTDGIGAIQEMLEISRNILGGSIILVDYRFHYLAWTKDFDGNITRIRKKYHGQTPSYIIDELLTDPSYFKVQNSREIFEYPIHDGEGTVPAICCNLFRKGETEYCARILLVSDEKDFTTGQKYLLEFLAEKVNAVYGKISDYSLPFPSLNGLREAIRNSLVKKPLSGALLSSTLKHVNWNMTDHYILIRFVPSFLDNTKEMNAVSRNQLELQYPGSCAVIYEECIVLLINLTRGSLFGKKARTSLNEGLSVFLRENLYKAGISNTFDNFSDIYLAYREACAALRIGNTKDSMFWYYYFSDYAMDYMLSKCTEEIPVRDLCQPGLSKLLAYDQENGSDYVHTLKVFLECKYNVTHAAESLYIHRTTLLKHLNKIRNLTNLDLDDWNTRMHLYLSFELLDLER